MASRMCLEAHYYVFNSVGKDPPAEPGSPMVPSYGDGQGTYEHRPSRHSDTPLSGSRSGQILWIRGLTRLQTQVSNFLACLCFLISSYTQYNTKSSTSWYLFQLINLSLLSKYIIYIEIWCWMDSFSNSVLFKRIRGTAC